MDELIFNEVTEEFSKILIGTVLWATMDDLLTGISSPASDLLPEVWDTWVAMSRVHAQ